jgi:hypothetical protein
VIDVTRKRETQRRQYICPVYHKKKGKQTKKDLAGAACLGLVGPADKKGLRNKQEV